MKLKLIFQIGCISWIIFQRELHILKQFLRWYENEVIDSKPFTAELNYSADD